MYSHYGDLKMIIEEIFAAIVFKRQERNQEAISARRP